MLWDSLRRLPRPLKTLVLKAVLSSTRVTLMAANRLIVRGDADRAERLIAAARERHPDDATLARRLADALEAQGKSSQAVHEVFELLGKTPGDEGALGHLKRLSDTHGTAEAEIPRTIAAHNPLLFDIAKTSPTAALTAVELLGSAGEEREARRLLTRAAADFPASEPVRSRLRRARRSVTPGILLCAPPHAGGAEAMKALCNGLGKTAHLDTEGGAFPHTFLPQGALQAVRQQRSAYLVHCDASPFNRIELSHRLDRMIVHLRDPREVLVAWAEQLSHEVRDGDSVQAIHLGLPRSWPAMSFEAQMDWHIETTLPRLVAWIEGWQKCYVDPAFRTQILFTDYRDLKERAETFCAEILKFYRIDPDLFDDTARLPEGTVAPCPGSDDWPAQLTADQRDRVSKIVPKGLSERFGWE